MQRRSHTYRIMAAVTGFLFLTGVSVPSGSHVGHLMAGHCEMPEQAVPIHHDDCAKIDATGHQDKTKSENHHSSNSEADCDLGFACGCSIGEAPVETQAVQPFSKKVAGLYPVSIDITVEIKSQPAIASHTIETEALEASPPLFLKHASFLN